MPQVDATWMQHDCAKADIHKRGLHVRFVPRPDMIGNRWLSAMINRDPRGLSIVYESGQALALPI